MMDTSGALVEHRTRKIAQEYLDKGYDVLEKPSQEDMPEFLAGYHPDLLLRKPGDMAVVTVCPRMAMTTEPQIWELAELLRERPGWRFELVMVYTGEQLDIPDGSRPFKPDDISEWLKKAERLSDSGFEEAAMMQAWAAAESIVRLLAAEEGWVADRPTATHTLNAAVYHGAISGNDYWSLDKARRMTNALAHGLTPPDFDDGLLGDLIGVTRRLLEAREPG